MPAYNISTLPNQTNLAQVFTVTNDASGGLFAWLTLLSLFVILLITLMRRNPLSESVTGAGFVLAIVSLGFAAMSITDIFPVILFSIITGAGAVSLYFNRGGV